MKWLWRTLAMIAFAVAALGLFWLLQGTGAVVVDPIACVGDCEPVEAPSVQWIITGAATTMLFGPLGVVALRKSLTAGHPDRRIG